ncbi:MAG: hypothetical protein ABI222_05170 [Opitutaceae bacterium]
MLPTVQNLFHRPAIRLGVMDDARGLCRNPRFASFMMEANRKPLDTHFHNAWLRGRRLVRQLLLFGLAAALVWIAFESVRALAVF